MSLLAMNLKVPDRWLACPQHSKLIADKFIVFKTPLDSKYDEKVGALKFNFEILKKSLEQQKLCLKLVIDMTFSEKYYDSSQLIDEGVHYVKIKCRGLNEAPDEEARNRFIEEVKKFKGAEGDVIGVHCTHGFNRSGYMLVSYMVEEFDFCLDAAITAFSMARYPGIYKEQYIQQLCDVYGMERDEVPQIPSNLPTWLTDENSNDHPNAYNSTKAFMDGEVQNVETVLDTEVISRVHNKVQECCQWTESGFAGSQPVSMSLENIKKIKEEEYMVSWKADGTRFLLYIEDENQVFLLDRDNTVFKPDTLTFPWGRDHLYNTLLDGEMVIDQYGDTRTPRFLAYDIIKMMEENVGEVDFKERMKYIARIVQERNSRVDTSREAFKVRPKLFFDLQQTRTLLKDFQKKLGHEMDGLVFQPVHKAYMAGQCHDILKWKPPHLNSIDFLAKIVTCEKKGHTKDKKFALFCDKTRVEYMKFSKSLKHLDQKIIECRWDFDHRCWIFMRERTDKSFPNSYKTYESVLNTIHHPVYEEKLFSFIYDPYVPATKKQRIE